MAVHEQDIPGTREPARPASGGCRGRAASSSIRTSTVWSPGVSNVWRKTTGLVFAGRQVD